MGNNHSNEYQIVSDEEYITAPKINIYHKKGKTYGDILNFKLKTTKPYDWTYVRIYDLRNGKDLNMGLSSIVYGNELDFRFLFFDKIVTIVKRIHLKYSNQSNVYMTLLR